MASRASIVTPTRLLRIHLHRFLSSDRCWQPFQAQRQVSTTPSSPLDHCLQILRNSDHASVLQIPFYPPNARSAFVAIKALNAELNAIPGSISSGKTMIGQMRYQWWRDAIDTCYRPEPPKVPTNHPVITALRIAIEQHKLTKYHFSRLIDARQANYLNPRFASVEKLISHSQATNFSMLALLLQCLGNSPTTLPLTTIDHALHHLSNAITLATLLHAFPSHYRSRGTSVVPPELMSCSEEDLFRLAAAASRQTKPEGQVLERVQQTVIRIATLAWSEFSACRDALRGTEHEFEKYESLERDGRLDQAPVEAAIRPVFLAATPARTYLGRLEAVHFDTFHPSLQKRDWKLPFQIWYDSAFGKV
ncbi:hypothetical protein CROQUDRAFT_721107 [Cronartium quercuum f. sp. fusiforme G11]|uniref:Phytoene synthase n=1 Tax=Cronartium quercuum f. sp. fusiforme G11 TaxID=708437 RepID=A0A9P6NP07_9BASI|nr:hypothetical protein CROQUDRAFT_721107 [Cronartium quercuum f. sp. fusiforme G11]